MELLDAVALPKRLASKIVIDEATGCWLWRGSVHRLGYATTSVRVSKGKRKNALVHRVVYELLVGPIQYEIDHLCRVKHCCNPAHLEDVTQRENKRRQAAVITHCPRGHPYDEENTRYWRGHRACRECSRQYLARRRGKDAAGPYSETRTCAVCSTPFTARQPWHKYCGAECNKVVRRETARQLKEARRG